MSSKKVCGGLTEDERKVCEDVLEKLRETEQVYIVGHDVPISISKTLFNMLNIRRIAKARKEGIPELQYEWEDFLWETLVV